jgi:hypothetical protein
MTKPERETAVNTLIREQEIADAKKPQPPKDFKKRWAARELNLFHEYLTGRAYADWQPSQLRLLCQAVELEIVIQDAYSDMAATGPIIMGASGQPIAHPATAVIGKLSVTQGALLRRLGIAVDGTVAPRDIKKNAKAATRLQGSASGSYAESLLAN